MAEKKNGSGLHDGHRQRLLDKIEQGSVCEHEYLEALLFSALPRKNTNDIAHKLLAEFGSIKGVLFAPVPALQRVEGVGRNVAAYLHIIGVCLQGVIGKQEDSAYPNAFEKRSFARFLIKRYESIRTEVLEFFMVDEFGRICSNRSFSSDTSSSICIEPRQIGEYFSTRGGSGVIMVHNHPFGDAKPSARDDVTTEKCKELASTYGLAFLDHLICAPNSVYSYQDAGIIKLKTEKAQKLPFEEIL